MKIIAGLGNPGSAYSRTPHNIGFEVVEELARRHNVHLRRSFRFFARTVKMNIAAQPVMLVMPLAHMNNSGSVLSAIMRKNGANATDLIVIADDADLSAGQMRIRSKGGSGGHRGIQSIIDGLAHNHFIRIRLGIGRNADVALSQYVLSPWRPEERIKAEPIIGRAADACVCILEQGVGPAMNIFNTPTESLNKMKT